MIVDVPLASLARQSLNAGGGSSGNLLVLTHPTGSSWWWGVVEAVFLPVLAICLLSSVAGQLLSFRRSSGERRQ